MSGMKTRMEKSAFGLSKGSDHTIGLLRLSIVLLFLVVLYGLYSLLELKSELGDFGQTTNSSDGRNTTNEDNTEYEIPRNFINDARGSCQPDK